jgi:hypothetical protein
MVPNEGAMDHSSSNSSSSSSGKLNSQSTYGKVDHCWLCKPILVTADRSSSCELVMYTLHPSSVVVEYIFYLKIYI